MRTVLIGRLNSKRFCPIVFACFLHHVSIKHFCFSRVDVVLLSLLLLLLLLSSSSSLGFFDPALRLVHFNPSLRRRSLGIVSCWVSTWLDKLTGPKTSRSASPKSSAGRTSFGVASDVAGGVWFGALVI